ncbi:MAG: ketopantoate reductase family protein [Chloroflexi bacterium]|nr:ketopantoate reductase family protein [Chloroflexota bacterium]
MGGSDDSPGTEVAALRRIAIIGAGAMGVSLAALTSSHIPTVLVIRNPQRAAQVREYGVRMEGRLQAEGRPEVAPDIDALAEIHPIDLVVIATKTTAIPEVCAAMRPHLRELPFLLSYQNGIEPAHTIMKMLGTPRVVRMVLNYGAALVDDEDGPWRVEVALHQPPHYIGGEGEESFAFAGALAPVLSAMGFPTKFVEDLDVPVWQKGVLNGASNPVAALVQAPLGELLASPAEPLIERLLDEGIAVAQASGIELGVDYREEMLALMRSGPTHVPSMAEDVIRGRATEITQLNVQIAEHGRQVGVPTPTHDAVIALIETIDWRLGRTVSIDRGMALP